MERFVVGQEVQVVAVDAQEHDGGQQGEALVAVRECVATADPDDILRAWA